MSIIVISRTYLTLLKVRDAIQSHTCANICPSEVCVFERERLKAGTDVQFTTFSTLSSFRIQAGLCRSETVAAGTSLQIFSVINLCVQMRLTLWFSRAESAQRCAMYACVQVIGFVYTVWYKWVFKETVHPEINIVIIYSPSSMQTYMTFFLSFIECILCICLCCKSKYWAVAAQ